MRTWMKRTTQPRPTKLEPSKLRLRRISCISVLLGLVVVANLHRFNILSPSSLPSSASLCLSAFIPCSSLSSSPSLLSFSRFFVIRMVTRTIYIHLQW